MVAAPLTPRNDRKGHLLNPRHRLRVVPDKAPANVPEVGIAVSAHPEAKGTV